MKIAMDNRVKEINLLLLYLVGWEEESRNVPGEKLFRAWKGYPFEILNELENEKMIRQFGKSQSLIFTEKGKAEAEKLKQKYLP